MSAYYNEIDPYAAQWLRNLISAGHIAPGDVDERSIVDVRPDDLVGYSQCHFFAGIGVWSHALRVAGWPDNRPVWTGSCPCQPFSAAGKGNEFDDARHLWPAWFRLIRERRPLAIFGEQVSSKDALAWLDHVCADLEAEAYSVGAVDSCAASVGAPHIRQRLFFVADASQRGLQKQCSHDDSYKQMGFGAQAGDSSYHAQRGADGIVGDAIDAGLQGYGRPEQESVSQGWAGEGRHGSAPGSDGALADAEFDGRRTDEPQRQSQRRASDGRPSATNGFWRDAIWLPCRDGKARAIKSGIKPLVNGAPARVGRLRAYGNAIVAPLAAEFIRSYIEARKE